uniref:Uncharacterized protein n=1 Tax=Glossina pallidipes TaxID=7398 RepID=A0A1A9Z992_GLOPL
MYLNPPGHMFAFKVLSAKCTQTETLLTQFTLKYACGSLLLLYKQLNKKPWRPTDENNNNTRYNNDTPYIVNKKNHLGQYCSPNQNLLELIIWVDFFAYSDYICGLNPDYRPSIN